MNLEQWKNIIQLNINEVGKRVDSLNSKTTRVADEIIRRAAKQQQVSGNTALNKNKKTIVNLEFDTGNGFGSLKQLATELDKMVGNLWT